jgi:hypothetical protein
VARRRVWLYLPTTVLVQLYTGAHKFDIDALKIANTAGYVLSQYIPTADQRYRPYYNVLHGLLDIALLSLLGNLLGAFNIRIQDRQNSSQNFQCIRVNEHAALIAYWLYVRITTLTRSTITF